jgi:glycosyltransferase involved in cell wall biosynthesis
MDKALDSLGSRVTVGLAIDAGSSQRLSVTLYTIVRVLRTTRRVKAELVVIDLSGRALAEFFSAIALAIVGSRRAMWLVVHDSPDLVGAPFLFRLFDRRGLRRLGIAISRTAGAVCERWLVGRADALIAFSELGAHALRDRFPRVDCWAVPLPAEPLEPKLEGLIVYCPSSLRVVDVQPVVAAIARSSNPEVRLRVGYMSPTEREELRLMSLKSGVADRVEFVGYLDQHELDESFATAAIVVRQQPSSSHSAWAAASGPIVSALAGGCAVVSTDGRGSRACVEAAGLDLSDSPARMESELYQLLESPLAIRHLQGLGTSHIIETHMPDVVGGYLADVWVETRQSKAHADTPLTPSDGKD